MRVKILTGFYAGREGIAKEFDAEAEGFYGAGREFGVDVLNPDGSARRVLATVKNGAGEDVVVYEVGSVGSGGFVLSSTNHTAAMTASRFGKSSTKWEPKKLTGLTLADRMGKTEVFFAREAWGEIQLWCVEGESTHASLEYWTEDGYSNFRPALTALKEPMDIEWAQGIK
jgi:hypothetical protein